MLPLVGKLGLKYIAMHKRGDARTMQSMTDYDDVVEDVNGFFKEFAVKAQECGVRNWILDPGFGFAKTVSQNYIMMRDLRRFRLRLQGGVKECLLTSLKNVRDKKSMVSERE